MGRGWGAAAWGAVIDHKRSPGIEAESLLMMCAGCGSATVPSARGCRGRRWPAPGGGCFGRGLRGRRRVLRREVESLRSVVRNHRRWVTRPVARVGRVEEQS